MFPIRDVRGRTIGFGGRVLDKGEPSTELPETELFHKRRELYGLYEARQATRNSRGCWWSRGYGCRASAPGGITHAVGALGTATTPSTCSGSSGWWVRSHSRSTATAPGAPRLARAENAVSEVKQGRQLRFSSCPTVTIRTRRSARRAHTAPRIGGAVPLADYLDRRARLAL